jgi:hypothetical protein
VYHRVDKYSMDRIIYHPRASGLCHIAVGHGGDVAYYDFGIVEIERDVEILERPRVAGYYVRIKGSDGDVWIGQSLLSIVAAMRVIDDELAQNGGGLLCAGLHDDFYESALSEGTGFGYISGYRDAVHIMERPLLDSRAKFLADGRPQDDDAPPSPLQPAIQRLRGLPGPL